MQQNLFRATLLLCGASLALAVFLAFWHLNDKSQIESSAREEAGAKAAGVAQQIDAELSALVDVGMTLAADLTSGGLADDQVEARLIRDLEANSHVSAVSAAYVPEFVSDSLVDDRRKPGDGRRLYAPYARFDSNGDPEIILTETGYDYTLPDGSIGPDGEPIRTVWYHLPLQTDGPAWGEPYFGAASREYWAGFGVPFYRADPVTRQQVAAGVVDVSLTLDRFQDLVAEIKLGEQPGRPPISNSASYAFILSRTGGFISHPIDEFVTGKKGIAQLGDLPGVAGLPARSQSAPPGEPSEAFIASHSDEKSGRSFWVFMAPISASGWWVGIALDTEEFLTNRDAQRLRRQRIWIAVAAAAFLFFLSVLLTRAYRGSATALWTVSVVFSGLSIATLAYLWFLSVTGVVNPEGRDILLIEEASSVKAENDFAREVTNPIYIPTGVFVQSVEFSSANNVTVTGYIWQRYPNSPQYADLVPYPPRAGFPITPGFILPEADSTDVSEAYRQTQGDEVVIGWYFRTVLRQEFDYAKYPFDQEEVWIRLWPNSLDRNVLLAPDLAAYTTTNPELKPGLEQQDFVLEGWRVTGSFFSYRLNSYNTNFGIEDFVGQQGLPELYFNVGLKREFINSFISNMIPIIVVGLLLFAVLLTVTSREEGTQLFGFSTSGVLSFCGALFFVIIVSHINLRTSLAAQGLVYLESFYFVMYGAILSVGVNAILVATPNHASFTKYRDNLLFRLLYWPVILGALVAITIFAFA